MNSPKFNQSIYPNKRLFYEDVKQFAKVYFVNPVAVRICQSFSSSKFPVLRQLLVCGIRIYVCEAHMHVKHAKSRGSGGMSPRKFKNGPSEIEFEKVFDHL